jgi:N12 class adenine-specific DNA methylase/adenine-specific DNA methylase
MGTLTDRIRLVGQQSAVPSEAGAGVGQINAREQAIIDRHKSKARGESLFQRLAAADAQAEIDARRQQRAYAEQAPPEIAEPVREMLSSTTDRARMLGALRKLPPEKREEALKLVPGVAQQLGDDRGGAVGRVGGALSRGVASVIQPGMELAGKLTGTDWGGTDEEIEFIRQLEAAASQEFAPARPGDPWYEVGGAGIGRAAATGVAGRVAGSAAAGSRAAGAVQTAGQALGRLPQAAAAKVGIKGVPALTAGKAGELAGVTVAAFPGQYAQEVDQLKALGMQDGTGLRLLAGGTAAITGLVEGIVPNPFGAGKVPLTEGAVKAARQYLWEAAKKAPAEMSEEYLQGVTSGLGKHVAQYLDENAEEKTIADAFQTGWDQAKEAALPMAFLLGVPALGGASLSALRAQRLARLQETRAKGFVSAEEAKELGIVGKNRNERRANADAEIEQLSAIPPELPPEVTQAIPPGTPPPLPGVPGAASVPPTLPPPLPQGAPNASQVPTNEGSPNTQGNGGEGSQVPISSQVRGAGQDQGSTQPASQEPAAQEVQVAPWQQTPSEYVAGETDADAVAVRRASHPQAVKRALTEGEQVPRAVLDAYANNTWAKKAIERLYPNEPGQLPTEPEAAATPPVAPATEVSQQPSEGSVSTIVDKAEKLPVPATPEQAEPAAVPGSRFAGKSDKELASIQQMYEDNIKTKKAKNEKVSPEWERGLDEVRALRAGADPQTEIVTDTSVYGHPQNPSSREGHQNLIPIKFGADADLAWRWDEIQKRAAVLMAEIGDAQNRALRGKTPAIRKKASDELKSANHSDKEQELKDLKEAQAYLNELSKKQSGLTKKQAVETGKPSTAGSSEETTGSPTVSPDAPATPETSKGKAEGENQSSEARADAQPELPPPTKLGKKGATKTARRMEPTEEGRPADGKPVMPGDRFLTNTGRETTPYPKYSGSSNRQVINAEKKSQLWLMENAIAEAESRGDEFNARTFRSELEDARKGKLPQASKDSATIYVFGEDVPKVPKPFLKDVSSAATQEPAGEQDTGTKRGQTGEQVGNKPSKKPEVSTIVDKTAATAPVPQQPEGGGPATTEGQVPPTQAELEEDQLPPEAIRHMMQGDRLKGEMWRSPTVGGKTGSYGAFYATNEEGAGKYSRGVGVNVVVSDMVELNNPLVVETKQQAMEELGIDEESLPEPSDTQDIHHYIDRAIFEAATEEGYDGVVYKEEGYSGNPVEVHVFNPPAVGELPAFTVQGKPDATEADFDAEMEKLMAGLAEPESGLAKPPTEKRPARKPRTAKKPAKTQEEKAADDRARSAAKKEEAKRKMREAFEGTQNRPLSGFDPEIGMKVAQAAKLYIEAGALDFRAFIRELVADFGKVWVEEKAPYFESVWRTANKLKWVDSPAGKVADVLTEVQDETVDNKPGADGNEAVGDGAGEPKGDAAAANAGPDEKRDAEEDTGQPSDSILPDGAETTQDDGRDGSAGSGTDGDTNANQSEHGSAGATDTGTGDADGAMEERLAVNHVIGQDDDLAVASVTKSLSRNIKALDILKALETEGRFPDEAERKALAQYTGWGGLSQALDSIKGERMLSDQPWGRDDNWEKKWGPAYRKLKDLLTKEEFQAAQDSTENAHYTSKPIIQAIWKIAERLGYNGGRALELGAGIGHFAGLTPSRVRGATQFTMVERDSVSSRIVKMLYPNHEVVAGDMEEFRAVPGSVTLGIGNVPFAGGTVGDSVRRYNEPLNLHNYAIARHLDAVAPGGIVVAVSSHSTLDANIKQRKFLATKGELIGAIRLPNDAFAENAKTEVVTDILIFRRPRQGDGTLGVRFDQNADVKVKSKDGEEVTRAINKYFLDNPAMVLGKHSAKGSMYGPDEYTVESTPGDLQSKLDAAIEMLPRDLLGSVDVAEKVVSTEESVPFGRLEIQSGKVVMGFGDKFVPILGKKFEDFPVHLTGKTGVSRAKDYIELRDLLTGVRNTMLDEAATDEAVKRSQRQLSASYDRYVTKHGPLSSSKTNIFKRDPDYYRVLALENERAEYNPATQKIEVTYTKAAIFTERVLGPQKEPDKADTTADAMSVSIAWRGAIDSVFIGKLLGVSAQEAEAKLLDEGLAFRNPSTTELELSDLYLSGNVRAKLEQAKISAEEDEQYNRNVDALTKVQPKSVTLKKDTVRLGATWIPEQVINAFATQEFGTDVHVSYNANTDAWTVGRVYGISETAKAKYETGRIDPDNLLSEVLNLRSIKIYDQVETGEYTASGKPKTTQTLNEKETQAAKHRASVLRAEFEKWVLSNPEVTQVLAKLYNDKYNNFVRTKYNGEFLVLPGANPEVTLRPYQKDAIWRIINRGTSLLAHAVGAGKTYTMIGAAMEMRRLGLARRPVIVVQNATLGQFATSFQQMYPNANVLVADKSDLGKGKRQLFLNKISTGNWDAVVIAQSTFDNMASEPQVERAFIQDQLDLLEEAIREEGGEGARTPTVKQLVRTKKSLKARFDKLMGSRAKKEDNVTFEDLGADALFLDEAHTYKKPTFTTKLSQLVGLNVEASARSLATTIKVRSIQAAHNGRNVVLATGTPVTNTLGEAWHMVNYVSPATNADFSSRTFDQFIGNFAQVEPTLTMNAGGQYVYKDAIVKFRNGHQLVEYINDSWDIVTPDALRAYMASSKKGFPQLRGGQPSAITVDRTPGVAQFMDFISRVYAQYKGLTAKERRELSFIPALAYGASKAATLDIRLVMPNAAEEKNSKLQKAAEEIKRIYDESSEVKGAQLFFSDMKNPFSMSRLRQFMGGETIDAFEEDAEVTPEDGTAEPMDDNESGSFLYQELKKKLLGMGIPKEQIAFISDAKTDKQRQALFERVNNGDIRVLIGSTAKMGIGVNVQKKLVALHHFDTPWLPADLEQREGRILRFGNENETVYILRYAMKKTLDGAIYMATARKQKFIWQVLNGQLDGDSFEDPSSAAMLSIEEQLAAIQDDPVFFEKIEIQNRLREMELERQSFYDAQTTTSRFSFS